MQWVPHPSFLEERDSTSAHSVEFLADRLMVWAGVYSLSLRIAAMMRGLRRPCIIATIHKGFSSGA